MSLRGRVKYAAMLLSFLTLSDGSLSCADRKGSFDGDCGHFYFHLRALHDDRHGGAPGTELVLSIGLGAPVPLKQFTGMDWKGGSQLCSLPSDHCEAATSARIRIESVSKNQKHASGTFVVDFRDGRHEEGKFQAKYHHEGPRVICE
jgi:hypothetical protein